jgi:hypothetical protein
LAPARRRTRQVSVDLHGYDVLTAVDLAEQRVRESWENGYDEVELLHGARDVRSGGDEGRGRIKTELLRMLAAGRFDPYADGNWPRAASLVLFLRPNPRPRRESWTPAPRRAYRR